jgi:hypothetical protein
MKRAWQLIALVAVLSLVSWLGSSRPADAYPSCALYQGHSCKAGAPSFLCGAGDFNWVCNCTGSGEDLTWVCAP